MSNASKKIGITMGDPLGVGPVVVAKAWRKLRSLNDSLVLYGDRLILEKAFASIGVTFPQNFIETSSIKKITSVSAAKCALDAIDVATRDALSNNLSAIVTAPVNKARIRALFPSFTGHTEYLAGKCGIDDVTMVFMTSDSLFIATATTHLPISEVSASLTTEKIFHTIQDTSEVLKAFKKTNKPKIAVFGLNPHAGEEGCIGVEEKHIIGPAIARANKLYISCAGPTSADGFFFRGKHKYDGIVAMYHDQAMIPAKMLGSGSCVNITWGLPFVRTSPGHGTAEDLKNLNDANEDGMVEAVRVAFKLL